MISICDSTTKLILVKSVEIVYPRAWLPLEGLEDDLKSVNSSSSASVTTGCCFPGIWNVWLASRPLISMVAEAQCYHIGGSQASPIYECDLQCVCSRKHTSKGDVSIAVKTPMGNRWHIQMDNWREVWVAIRDTQRMGEYPELPLSTMKRQWEEGWRTVIRIWGEL